MNLGTLSIDDHIYVEMRPLVDRVLAELPQGRIASWYPILHVMGCLVAHAGAGDHLEIGVLHGGTAILAALVKERFGLPGQVVAVDPLAGYYPRSPIHPQGVITERGKLLSRNEDELTHVPVTPEVFLANVAHFGVAHRVELIQAFSYPWPEQLEHRRFVSAYIDGDHYYDGPTHDWENVSPRIELGGLVWMDDCNENCPGVIKAAELATHTPGWRKVTLFDNQTFIIERVALKKEDYIKVVGPEQSHEN